MAPYYIPNSNHGKKKFNYELLLDFNNFKQQAAYNDMEALAKVFQNIMILNPGNLPNQPELGIGISSYEFEILDEQLITELTNKIKTQCSRFAPNNYIYDVTVEKLKLKNGLVSLAIFFYLSKYTKEKGEPNVAVLFNKQRVNSKLLSSIYV